VAPAALCAGLCLTGGALQSQAQITPSQQKLLTEFVGDRAEVGIVLGASDAASSGSYTVDGKNGNDDLDFSLMKIGGGGEIGKPRPLGSSSVQWAPVIFGNVGLMSGKNDLAAHNANVDLRGDKLDESALGMQVGGGVALHLTERLTVTPYVGLLYGHYELDYTAHSADGKLIKAALDDSADTLGATPGISIAYKMPLGKNTLELSARYTFYGSDDVSDSNLDVGGASHVFEQKADIDIPLPWEIANCPLHTGGFLSLTETGGDISDSMASDSWATIHGRLLMNTEGKFWKMDRAGLGMSYIAAEHFSGWDVGIEVSFKF